jgi:Zn-dependent M28 family amino/carboxypeptidase
MFIAFGAEELGLIGSNLYCREPLVPLSSVAAMINLDMIGRLRDNTLYVIGENTGQEWAAMLRRYNNSLNYVAMGDAGTDYRCFKQAGRPVMSLFTGLHAEYHKPTDDTELIDVPSFTAITTLALHLAVNTAVRPRPFTR